MNVYDKLFQLQLRLKQNKVNQQRKRDEVKRLSQSYENQVYHLLYLLYSFSNHAWFQLNRFNEFNASNTTQKTENTNYSDIYSNISNILNEPENKPKASATTSISEGLSQLFNDLNKFLNSDFIDKNSDSPFPISLENFILILTLFNFFWSQESSDLFTNFLRDLEPSVAIKYIKCLIIHPSIQIFFTSALKPIFYQISSLNDSQNIDLKQNLLDSLFEFSPLIPTFLKAIFTELNMPIEEKSKVFYEIFLRNFLVNFSAFGIFHSEISLFHKEEIQNLINSLDIFFKLKEGETQSAPNQLTPEKFFETLFSKSQSICVIPNEERLINVSKSYSPTTIIDKRTLELTKNHFSKQTPPINLFDEIPNIPLFYVPHNSSPPNLSTKLISRFTADSAVNIASRILLRSNLIHIEDTDANSNATAKSPAKPPSNLDENYIPTVSINSTSMKPFEYFEKIADLSFSRVADPQVEVDLDKLEPLVSTMTLEELCQLIENELSMIEMSSNNITGDGDNALMNDNDQDDDIVTTLTSATSASDPLQRISLYSTQFSLISKISTFMSSQISSSTDAANFIIVSEFVENYVNRIKPLKNIEESKQFTAYYKAAFDDMMSANSEFESSPLSATSLSAENLKLSPPTAALQKPSSSANNIRQITPSNSNSNLIENLNGHSKFRGLANIQPDYVTHRNFHSSLSFKLDLLNKIKMEKQVEDEANSMKKFLMENRDKLIDSQQHKFLDIYVKEPSRLKFFNDEFKIAFTSNMPFVRVDHIHQAYQALIGLLQIQGMNEIGADQIIPFAMVATVLLMTENDQKLNLDLVKELTFTYTYLSRYIEPFISTFNMLNHNEEYSLIQFLSTYQYLHQSMMDAQKA